MLRPWATSRTAVHSAPDWEMKAMLPGRGILVAKLAFMDTSWSVLITPRQLGPTRGMSARLAASFSRLSSSTPWPPTSLKPAVMTTAPLAPIWPACCRVSMAASGGTTITTRSTGSGTSTRRG